MYLMTSYELFIFVFSFFLVSMKRSYQHHHNPLIPFHPFPRPPSSIVSFAPLLFHLAICSFFACASYFGCNTTMKALEYRGERVLSV
jgi:hypothetical protein